MKMEMGELCLASTTSSMSHFPILIFSDFALFCSLILSHPLYFSYFIFFSPYLLKLLSFLSPLFITTSLLLLALIWDNSICPKLTDPEPSFLLSTFHAIMEKSRPKIGQEFLNLEEVEAYKKIVFLFDTTSDIIEHPVQVYEDKCLQAFDQVLRHNLATGLEEIPCKVECIDLPLMEEKRPDEENLAPSAEEKTVEITGPKSNKVVEQVDNEEESKVRNGSKAMDIINVRDNTVKVSGNGEEYTEKVPLRAKSLGQKVKSASDYGGEYTCNYGSPPTLGSNLGSYGSMRKEKEWKRTLACKLFEERHNVVEGDEGMDSLWETYESSDSSKSKRKGDNKKKNVKRSTEIDYYGDEEDDAEEEFEMTNGQLCCLQALKFSAGKMNLGMGRPSLVKISKALKGMGWLHHVKRHAKRRDSN